MHRFAHAGEISIVLFRCRFSCLNRTIKRSVNTDMYLPAINANCWVVFSAPHLVKPLDAELAVFMASTVARVLCLSGRS